MALAAAPIDVLVSGTTPISTGKQVSGQTIRAGQWRCGQAFPGLSSLAPAGIDPL